MQGFVLAFAQHGLTGMVVVGDDHTADLAHEAQGNLAFSLDPCQVFEGCQRSLVVWGNGGHWRQIAISDSNSRLACASMT